MNAPPAAVTKKKGKPIAPPKAAIPAPLVPAKSIPEPPPIIANHIGKVEFFHLAETNFVTNENIVLNTSELLRTCLNFIQ